MATTSLVLELQQMASDPAVPVSSLLLKAKMVAVKLGRRELVAQLDHEISGYSGELEGMMGSHIDLLTRASIESDPNEYFRTSALHQTEVLYAA